MSQMGWWIVLAAALGIWIFVSGYDEDARIKMDQASPDFVGPVQ